MSLNREIVDLAQQASTLSNIGGVYSVLGEKQTALNYYNQALSLNRQVGDLSGEATTLNNIGVIYSSLKDKQNALDYYLRIFYEISGENEKAQADLQKANDLRNK